MDTATANRLRALVQQDVNWDYLVRLGHRNWVTPLLYSNLNKACPKAVPLEIMGSLRLQFHRNAEHNLLLIRELLRLLKLLKEQGVHAIPFKGPVLATFIYGHLSLRQFSDIDILVRPADSEKATMILRDTGYQFRDDTTAARKSSCKKPQGSSIFVRDGLDITVDLQWGAAQLKHFYRSVFSDENWKHIAQIVHGGATISTLPPETLLLHLCVHGSKHCWERLAWICDIAELLRAHPEMNWESLIDSATKQGNRRMLLLGLTLAHDLLSAELPEDVLKRTQADSVGMHLSDVVSARLYSEPYTPIKGTERKMFHLKMMERVRDKLRYSSDYLRQVIPPNERDRAVISLPHSFSSLYFIIRPIRLLSKYGLGSVKLLQHQFKLSPIQGEGVSKKSATERSTSASKSL